MSGFIGNGPNGAGRFSRFQFTASAGQTVFGGTDKNGLTLRYTPGQIEAVLNGSWLAPDDIVATNGSTITIAQACSAGDSLYIFAPTNFGIVDSVSYLVQQGLTPDQQALARANMGVSKKNYVVNGGMQVSQENGANAVGSGYPVDQFALNTSGTSGTFTGQQVASATPGGSPNRFRFTVTAADAAIGAGDIVFINTKLEGYRIADLRFGSSAAKTVILQFGCKGPAGTYCVVLLNGANNRSYGGEYTIAAGEANTDVVKSVSLIGDTSGTWVTDNTAGLEIRWGLMAGSTFQQAAGSWGATNAVGSANQFNLMSTVGNVFELFDVGLYEGVTAPAFQLPDFASELALCQRYWESSYQTGQTIGAATSGMIEFFVSSGIGSYQMPGGSYKVRKRAVPTVTIYPVNGGAAGNVLAIAQNGVRAASIEGAADTGFNIFLTGMTQADLVRYNWVANARL